MNTNNKVIFTPDAFVMQKWGGVSNSFVNIANELINYKYDVTIFSGFHGNRHLDEYKLRDVGIRIGKNKNLWKAALSLSRFWMRVNIPSSYSAVIHDTYYHNHYTNYFPKAAYVVTVHDMIADIFPNDSGWSERARMRRKMAVQKAHVIVTPSKATANDLVRLWNIDWKKIVVAPHGVRKREPIPWKKPEWPYILYVGGRKRYKDFTTACKTLALTRAKGYDVGIICFGEKLSTTEQELFDFYGIPESRFATESGSDAKLTSIYANAVALIYTSKYEGFGMPILEAMAAGCPVLIADTPACKEAAGGAALVASIGDEHKFTENLSVLLSDAKTRSELINLGLKRASDQSWDKSSMLHSEAYKLAMEHKRKSTEKTP